MFIFILKKNDEKKGKKGNLVEAIQNDSKREQLTIKLLRLNAPFEEINFFLLHRFVVAFYRYSIPNFVIHVN